MKVWDLRCRIASPTCSAQGSNNYRSMSPPSENTRANNATIVVWPVGVVLLVLVRTIIWFKQKSDTDTSSSTGLVLVPDVLPVARVIVKIVLPVLFFYAPF